MIRSVLALACLAAIATAAPVNEDAGLTARPAATAMDAAATDLDESAEAWGRRRRRRFGDSRRRFGDSRRRRTYYCPVRAASWGGFGGWGNWGGWSGCNSNGDRWRTRYSYRGCSGAQCGGRSSCPGSNRRSNSAHSNIKTHCARHNWGGWSACTATCGTGVQHRYRGVRVWNSCGGNGCPTGSQSQSCNTQKCPVDCKVAYWGGYNACSKSCGGGSQRRTRQLTQPTYGGKGCPTHYQNRACGQGPCAVHCTVSAFSAWTACTKSCGKGSQSRSRAIRTRADHGGYVCPYLRETRSCNKQACAVDCVFGSFRAWSTCTKSCGTGSQERSRSIKQPTFGGKVCPHSAETRACNTAACAINCKFGDFSKWTACTLSCGTGSQKRSRATTEPQNGGKACPHAAETRACNAAPCPINGGWTAFDAWSACSKSCDVGSAMRARTCTSPAPQFGGKPCPDHAKETKTCNTHVCNCPFCTFKDGHMVVGHKSEHSKTATHGPRTVHASCANRAQQAFCGKSFVIAHKCIYNRDTDKCACVCRKPTAGQARDHHVIRVPSHKQTNGKVVKNSKLTNTGAAPKWSNPAVVVNKD